jgi:hypothetical protein
LPFDLYPTIRLYIDYYSMAINSFNQHKVAY